MYCLITPERAHLHSDLLAKVFRLRARVFGQSLGWVPVTGEEERDRYDDAAPVYLVHLDAAGEQVYAAARFLPTTGPTLLADVFGETVPDAGLASPFVWECTRLCVDDALMRAHGRSAERFAVLRRMLLAGVEFALEAGIEAFLANFDDVRLRMWRRAGARIDVIGTGEGFSCGAVHLGLMEVSEAAREDLAGRLSLPGRVLSPLPPARAAAALAA